jgi:hypothetical protein
MKNLYTAFDGLKQGPLIRKKNTWTGMRLALENATEFIGTEAEIFGFILLQFYFGGCGLTCIT